MATKRSKKARKPREGFSGSIGLNAEDDVVDTAFQENVRPIRPESEGGAADFAPDTGREPLASGGARRGEAKQLSEEEDDFEDGRSSSGIYSRGQEDQIGRGDVGSRAINVRSGVLSVEGPGDADVVEGARDEEIEEPEDLEGPSPHEHQGVVGAGAETSRPADAPRFEKSPGIAVPDERYVEIARSGRARSLARGGSGRRGAGARRRSGERRGAAGKRTSGKRARKTGRKTYSQNA